MWRDKKRQWTIIENLIQTCIPIDDDREKKD